MGRTVKYLMLDKNDITRVCGVITKKEARKELNMEHWQFDNFMKLGKLFRNKYVLVEEDFNECERRVRYG